MTFDAFEDPSDTREAILGAAYRALCEHGYDDLTMGAIGDEFEKSTSLVYHYYDGKDDLLVDFLGFMIDEHETDVPASEYDDAHDHLRALLDHVLPGDLEEDRRSFAGAMFELRAQAVHDPAYREAFTRSDQFFRDQIASIVDRGIAQGVFREVDADRVAAHLLTTLHGAMHERVTADSEDEIPAVRAELQAHVERRLLADPDGSPERVERANGRVDGTGPDEQSPPRADPEGTE